MATFLELAQDLARESGTMSPTALTSTTGITGRAEKVVSWVRKAWINIQNSRSDWRWMQGEFTGELTASTAKYSSASFPSITRWGDWIEDRHDLATVSIWDPETGQSDEGHIEQLHYEDWFRRYGINEHDENRPIHWAIHPDGSLVFGPTPDKAYMVRGLYMKAPQVLTEPGDVPELPSRYHDIITLEAHRLLMIADGAYQESGWVQGEYIRNRYELERDQLPEVRLG